jgi:hypothetical protein
MQRRKFVVGLGSLAAGGAAAMGTGAFTSVEANGVFEVTIEDDTDALLGLKPGDGPNGEYAFVYTSGQGDLEINLADGAHVDSPTGSGVNSLARTEIDGIFKIVNQGTQPVTVEIEKTALSSDISGISDSTLHDQVLTFYRGNDPSQDAIEAGTSGDVGLSAGSAVSVGVEIDLTDQGTSSQPGKLISDGLGNLPIRAEA